jgi:hypothetical protein
MMGSSIQRVHVGHVVLCRYFSCSLQSTAMASSYAVRACSDARSSASSSLWLKCEIERSQA